MASLWHSAWDVYLTVVWAGFVAGGLAWLHDVRHGKTSLRDRRGRLRPAPVLALTFAALFAASGTVALLT
jgi:hypothetical protein